LWDDSESEEILIVIPTYTPGFDEVFTSNGTAVVSLAGFTTINTWTGAVDNDWHTGGNWSQSAVPTSAVNVVIPTGLDNYPTLSVNGNCNNILLQANGTGIASILGNDLLTVAGTAVVQTNITNDQWHMVSAPVGGQIAGLYYLNGTPKVFITEFDEPTNSYQYITDLSTPLEDMVGYMLWVNDFAQIYNYVGTMNSGTFGSADNLTRLDQGWNEIGNPYPSSIDWDASTGWTKTNLDDAIYIINAGNWASYIDGVETNGGSRYVAPGQGFFTRVSDGNTSGTLIMNDDVRVHNNTTFLKSEQEVNNFLKLKVFNDSTSDETAVRFLAESTDEFDKDYDAIKKFAMYDHIPQLYSISDVNYSINCLPDAASIDLGFELGFDGEFTISLIEIDNIGQVWLKDKLLDITIDLVSQDYTFSYSPEDDPNRFELDFNPVTVIDQYGPRVLIYSHGNNVKIDSETSLQGRAIVYNLMGQELLSISINGSKETIHISQPGYYFVKVYHDGQFFTRKVVIN
jgi:hypothetical protein